MLMSCVFSRVYTRNSSISSKTLYILMILLHMKNEWKSKKQSEKLKKDSKNLKIKKIIIKKTNCNKNYSSEWLKHRNRNFEKLIFLITFLHNFFSGFTLFLPDVLIKSVFSKVQIILVFFFFVLLYFFFSKKK